MKREAVRPLPDPGLSWGAVQLAIDLALAHLALGEAAAAGSILAETAAALRRGSDPGSPIEPGATDQWPVKLTAAELRLLPYLATHLTIPEIADQLFVTSHTARSEAKSIYRKLDASSRAEAIERAVDAGFLEPAFPHRAGLAV